MFVLVLDEMPYRIRDKPAQAERDSQNVTIAKDQQEVAERCRASRDSVPGLPPEPDEMPDRAEHERAQPPRHPRMTSSTLNGHARPLDREVRVGFKEIRQGAQVADGHLRVREADDSPPGLIAFIRGLADEDALRPDVGDLGSILQDDGHT
jgi:hypothetical protein